MVVSTVLDVVARTAPEIRGGLSGRRESITDENPSGETQLAADIWADELLTERLSDLDEVGEIASEERPDVLEVGSGVSIAMDPLDGSSNLQSNNAMGTIIGIYDSPLPARGEDIIASAYVLYGPITTMMVGTETDVTEYLIDETGTRQVLHESVLLPTDPVVYGFGGRVPDWTETFTAYARDIESELKLRYGGAMIADVNQVMTYGGIFAYPELESNPNGKLRLQFEGNPLAHIVRLAGGRSSNGTKSLLTVDPTDLHQRTPVYLGNTDLIERRESR